MARVYRQLQVRGSYGNELRPKDETTRRIHQCDAVEVSITRSVRTGAPFRRNSYAHQIEDRKPRVRGFDEKIDVTVSARLTRPCFTVAAASIRSFHGYLDVRQSQPNCARVLPSSRSGCSPA